MTTVSFPQVTTTISGAVVAVANEPQKILVVSQKTAAGTAVSGDLNENIQADANTLAGLNSIGATVVRAVRSVNEDTRVDAIFLDDNVGGSAAVGAVDFAGSTATESGELTVIIGSERNHKLSVGITSGDGDTDIADALAAAVTADPTIQVTASSALGKVDLTAVNDGTVGNELVIEVRGEVAGVTAVLTAMTGGATDPVLTGVFDVIGDTRYQTILWTWDDTTELGSFVDSRFNVTDDIQDGLGYAGKMDTLSNHLATLGALNNFINYTADKTESTATLKGPAGMELTCVQNAYAGSLRALKLTEGAAIASLNVGDSGLDGIGGPALASRPLANTPIFEMIPIRQGRGWTRLEIAQLNDVGGSVIGNNRAGNQIVLGEQLTLRNTSGGSPDDSFKFVNYFDTSVNIREYYDNNLRKRYGQSRMVDGSPISGRPSVNKRNFEASLIEFYDTLSGPDFALTRAGEENRNFFIQNLVVIQDIQTGTFTWSAKSPIVTQVRNINGNIQIAFAISEGQLTPGEG